MNERKLNSSHDIYLDGSSVARTLSTKESMIQKIKCYLKTFVGECFVNEDHGVSWLTNFLGADSTTTGHMKKIIKDNVESINGVDSVTENSIVMNGRTISGTIKIKLSTNETVSVTV